MNDEKNTSTSEGTSLAVRQFHAVVMGWVPVHKPSQPWRVDKVVKEQRYCLACIGERTFDVISGVLTDSTIRHEIAVCRCCGKETKK